MTAIYRIVSPRRLTAPALVSRSLAARVLYHHLLAGEVACQVPGLVRVGVLGLAEETGLDPAVVRDALGELVDHQLAEVDEVARLIRLPGVPGDHARALSGRNNAVGMVEALRAMPESPVRTRHAVELQSACPPDLRPLWAGLVEGAATASEPPSNPLRTKEKEKEKEEEKEEKALAPSPAGAREGENAPTRKPTLSEVIRDRRTLTGLSLTALAKRSGLPVADLAAFEADETPTRSELRVLAAVFRDPDLAEWPLPERDESVVVAVVQRLHERRIELGIVAADAERPAIDGRTVRLVIGVEGGLPVWLRAIDAMAELVRREVEDRGASTSAQFFTLDHLAKPENRRRYLDNPDLQRRRPPKRQRGSPRGPAPPVNAELEPEIEHG